MPDCITCKHSLPLLTQPYVCCKCLTMQVQDDDGKVRLYPPEDKLDEYVRKTQVAYIWGLECDRTMGMEAMAERDTTFTDVGKAEDAGPGDALSQA